MCQGENIMEDNRREEKEALKVLTEYSPKLLKSMRNKEVFDISSVGYVKRLVSGYIVYSILALAVQSLSPI